MSRGDGGPPLAAGTLAQLMRGNMREVLARWPERSVHAVVTDPPYELGFMGKSWDASGVAFQRETWAQVLRVLRPGGHALVFGGTRTFHRIAVALEGFNFLGVERDDEGAYLPIAEARIRACGALVLRA